jgi:hypothetical protein
MRKRPVCALCGLPLKGGSIEYQYGLPGKPKIGWHMHGKKRDECWDRCELRPGLRSTPDGPADVDNDRLIRILLLIQERGPGRLVVGPAWSKFIEERKHGVEPKSRSSRRARLRKKV